MTQYVEGVVRVVPDAQPQPPVQHHPRQKFHPRDDRPAQQPLVEQGQRPGEPVVEPTHQQKRRATHQDHRRMGEPTPQNFDARVEQSAGEEEDEMLQERVRPALLFVHVMYPHRAGIGQP